MAILATTTQGGGIKTVNARDLHEALEIPTVFANWMKRGIKALGLKEEVDYLKRKTSRKFSSNLGKTNGEFLPNLEKTDKGGRARIEYHLTVSAAQRIAVGTNTEIGHAIWDYLKKAEDLAKTYAANQLKLEQRHMTARIEGKTANLGMNEALKAHRESLGKGTKAFIYSNEASMIDAIVLGMNPKEWKREQGLPDAAPVRDHITADQLELMRHLEERNADWMNWGISGVDDGPLDYDSRKHYMGYLAASFIGQRDLIRELEATKLGEAPATEHAA